VPFIAPINPPVHPEHPAGSTAAQISEINRQHKEDKKNFRQYHAIDNALRNQLIAAVPHIYISTLSDDTVGFGNVTCLQIISRILKHNTELSLPTN
jgi:ribosomal protein L9